MNDFLTEMPTPYEDEYYYFDSTGQVSCNYDVKHDTNSEYINSSTIRITDNQVVTEYEYNTEHSPANVKNTKSQTVTYDFTKYDGGNYYLTQVTVK